MTKKYEMEDKVLEIYDYIVEKAIAEGIPPTVREICDRFQIKSTSSSSYYLRKLESMGKIKINEGQSRSIKILNYNPIHPDDCVQVPLIGDISAGPAILAVENLVATYPIPKDLISTASGDYYMLKVDGTSMIDVGINDGDFIILRKQPTAENGQIVAALLEGEYATVKRFYKEPGGVVRLHPENQYMRDIYPTDISVLGIVVGLIRTKIK